MIRRPTTRRTGTSLLEVLVGLGILAIGAISAFVLFPFAAINVSRALVDDRTTTCAVTADGQMRDIHRRYVVELETRGQVPYANEDYHRAMDDPGPYGVAGVQPLPRNLDAPSYPVFVDPMGCAINTAPVGRGSATSTLIPRVSLSLVLYSSPPGAARVSRPNGEPEKLALRYCSQLDGLLFDEGGAVSTQNPNDMRELRYNWLWVLQRPVNRDRHTVRQQVVVFNRRAHLYAAPGSEQTYGNDPSAAAPRIAFAPGENTITGVPQNAEVSKGTWVMDGTIGTDNAGRPIRHAEWYRVTSVTEAPPSPNGAPTTLTLEVHKPISRVDGLTPRPGINVTYNGTLVVFPGVVEVFERPVLTGVGAP